MSGIVGIVHFSGDPPLRDEVQQLSAAVAHRGAARKATFTKGPIALAYRGFGAGDIVRKQPVQSSPQTLIFDGVLFGGTPEAILKAWKTRGPACLADVCGDFALALWDADEEVCWLARDAVGSRPLYRTRNGSRHAFASEIGPLLGLPWVSRELATDHIAEFLSFRYVHAPRTLLRDVEAVPSGHAVRIDSGGVRVERWWYPRWSAPGVLPPPEEDVIGPVDRALGDAVGRRATEDDDVAVLLSGGLDSSAILWHLAEQGRTVPAYTVALADDPVDESSFAGRVAKVMGADHRVVRVGHRDLVDYISTCTRMMGHPLSGASAVLQHLLFAAIRPDARVVLSGDGGDEVLAGRGMDAVAQRLRRARLVGTVAGPASGSIKGVIGRLGLRDLAASETHFGRDRYIGGSHVFHSSARVEVLRDPGMVRPGIRRLVLDPLYQEVDSDPINAILHVWQRGWLPEDSLSRSDRMSAHAGVEVRYPLLDRDFMQLCASIPGPVKVHPSGLRWVTKWPLRQAMQHRMPDRSYLRRPKRSLPNPLDRWLRGQGSDFLRDAVEGLLSDPTALFEPSAVRRLMTEHLQGAANHGLKLWTLTLFHIWRREMGV